MFWFSSFSYLSYLWPKLWRKQLIQHTRTILSTATGLWNLLFIQKREQNLSIKYKEYRFNYLNFGFKILWGFRNEFNGGGAGGMYSALNVLLKGGGGWYWNIFAAEKKKPESFSEYATLIDGWNIFQFLAETFYIKLFCYYICCKKISF